MTSELQQLPRRQEEHVVFERRARRLWSKVLRAVLAVTAFVADPLDLGTIIIVWHMTRAVPVLDIRVVFMAPDAMEDWRRGQGGEKGRKGDEGVWWCR